MLIASSVSTSGIAAFAAIVAIVLVIAWFSVLIHGRLPRGQGFGRATTVRAVFFRERFKYMANGPLAELIVLMGTIAFVTTLFWLLLNRGG